MFNQDQRPVFLNLLKIAMPIPAVVSILHRLTGVAMFLAMPLAIWLFSLSAADQAGFERARAILHSPPVGLLGLLLLWALLHHLLAGFRYLLLDLDLGLDLPRARASAWGVLAAALLITLAWGALS